MTAHILDLDGTIFEHGTNDYLIGAEELIQAIVGKGHKIIITTYRGDENFEGHPIWGKQETLDALENMDFPYHDIVFDVPSPRYIYNDGGCVAINHLTNTPVPYAKLVQNLEGGSHG